MASWSGAARDCYSALSFPIYKPMQMYPDVDSIWQLYDEDMFILLYF